MKVSLPPPPPNTVPPSPPPTHTHLQVIMVWIRLGLMQVPHHVAHEHVAGQVLPLIPRELEAELVLAVLIRYL